MKATLTPAATTPSTFPALFISDSDDGVWLIREFRPKMQEATRFIGVLIYHSSNLASVGMSIDFGHLGGMSRFTGSITLENDK